jgi:hypothetical protein
VANYKNTKIERSKALSLDKIPSKNSTREYESFYPHWRIINKEDIGGDKIICDCRHFQSANTRSFEIDLTLTIVGWGGDGIYKEPVRICDFARVKKTFWHVTNNLLEIHNTSSSIKSEIVTKINEIKRIYSYLFRNGIYELRQVTPEIITHLISEYRANDGWWNLLDYEGAFNRAFDRALSNPIIANEICGIDKKGLFNFKQGKLDRHLGLPLSGFRSNEWQFRANSEFHPENESKIFEENTIGINYSVLRKICRGLNLLHFDASDVDTISFLPFISELQFSVQHQSNTGFDGRTKNTTPEFAVELITLCYEWIYKKAPHVISLLKRAREYAECVVDIHKDQTKYQQRTVNWNYMEMIQTHYEEIKNEAGFEWSSISLIQKTRGDISLSDLVKMVHQACFHMIGINHGRRKNEILGCSDLPYGLYLGCISDLNPDMGLRSIRIYIEKTVQDWVEFPANKLVSDAVIVLEKIYQLHRPLNSPPIEVYKEHKLNEHHKLFVLRRYSISSWGDLDSWPKKVPLVDQRRGAILFFNLLEGEYPSLVRKSHINRRFFSCLYYYRFEYAELGAISDHLCHESSLSTNIYINDPDTRGLGESMQTLWRRELSEQARINEEVEQEYFEYTMKQILRGEKVGGYFPRLISKRMKTLSKNIEFRKLSDNKKASYIAGRLTYKGYAPNPKANGVCMVGTNKRTLKHSNCFDEGVNPQDASPNVCSGCIHLFTNHNYIRVMNDEVNELQQKSKDFRLPIQVRKQAEVQSLDLIKIIDLEISLSEDNQKILSETISLWQM